MKKLICTAAAAGAVTTGFLAFAATAGAQETNYPPEVCTTDVNGVETVVPCVDNEVVVVDQGNAAAEVAASGTLPYTGNDSTLPLAEIGVALVAAGGAAVMVVRHRRTASGA